MQKTLFRCLPALVAVLGAGLLLPGVAAKAQAPAKATAPAPLAGIWTVDPVHTNVNFTISHLGLSEVRGSFDTVSGTIVADTKHPINSSVQFTIQVASVDTNSTMRDNDLKSKNYFDADTYPTITFQSTKVVKSKGGGVAYGNLTIHGITRLVALPFTLEGPIVDPWGNSRIGIVINGIVISRLDYKVGGNDTISDGAFAIGKDATVDISLEATPSKPS
jgi:polyisoprenoid-binding protein YceI